MTEQQSLSQRIGHLLETEIESRIGKEITIRDKRIEQLSRESVVRKREVLFCVVCSSPIIDSDLSGFTCGTEGCLSVNTWGDVRMSADIRII